MGGTTTRTAVQSLRARDSKGCGLGWGVGGMTTGTALQSLRARDSKGCGPSRVWVAQLHIRYSKGCGPSGVWVAIYHWDRRTEEIVVPVGCGWPLL